MATATAAPQPLAAQQPGDALWVSSWVEGEGERTIRERQADDAAQLLLYCSWFCPFAQRAWFALEEKGVPYKYVEINPYQVDPSLAGGYTKKALPLEVKRERMPEFLSASPRGLVPAVAKNPGNGDPVWESLHVVRYIDEQFKDGPALLPSDPLARARVGIWADHVTERVQKSYYIMLMSQDKEQQVEAKKTFHEECRRLARAMDPTGPFFLGSQVCLVDIAAAPFWQRFLWVGGHYRGLELPTDEPEFQRLHKWWAAISERPSFKRTLVCKERLIASYSDYAQGTGTSDYARSLASALRSGKGGGFPSIPVWSAVALAFLGGVSVASLASSVRRK